ncbi:MAG: acyl--CoA ligase [Acidimicrobiales bacterium]|nr:acyl--CoA ligase [Acidimicrobiales bacterium]
MQSLPAADPNDVAEHTASGWWGTSTTSSLVRSRALQTPERTAFVSEHDRMSWAGYDRAADAVAAALLATGAARGERVAVLLPDGPLVHAAFVGAERAGLVVMGIGHRAGEAELAHLVGRSGARTIVTGPHHRGAPAADLVARVRERAPALIHHVVLDGPGEAPVLTLDGSPAPAPDASTQAAIATRAIGPSELVLLNSTSGTTGLPKCVMQTQNRWFAFHRRAAEFGALTADDVCMSVVPAPFGFGLWTAHYTPTILGVPCVTMEHFDPAGMIRLIEQERVSVLCCVSTQFIMMLNEPSLADHDVSSLRVMFTGGEAIPYERAAEFEERTGCTVLNFYGSNETGMLSGTRLSDPRELRLRTAGRVLEEMHVRLYVPDTRDRVPGDRGEGQPACRGPALSLGYFDDEAANAALHTDDGWMLMGDVVTIDDEGWLRVVGRTSDFIIRGGKNISAPAVEDEIASHPAVAMVAVVPAPDPVFGERVAAYVELHDGAVLDLPTLRDHLAARGVSKEWWPERLAVLDALPRASGGKIAKGDLRRDAQTRFAEGAQT